MNLLPAIRIDGKLYIGEADDRHENIIERENLTDVPDSAHGFVDGKTFMSRKQAASFLKYNDPKAYRAIKDDMEDGLTSELYARAKGIWQKSIPTKESPRQEPKEAEVSSTNEELTEWGYDD